VTTQPSASSLGGAHVAANAHADSWQARAAFWAERLGAELGQRVGEYPSGGDPTLGLSTSLCAAPEYLSVSRMDTTRWCLESKRPTFQLDGAGLAHRSGESGEGEEEEVVVLSEPGQAVAWSIACCGENFLGGVCPRAKTEQYLPECFTHRTDVMWAMSGNNLMKEGGAQPEVPGFTGLQADVRYNFVLEFRSDGSDSDAQVGSFWCFWDGGEDAWSHFLVSDAVPLDWQPVPFAASDHYRLTLLAAVHDGGGHLVKSARKS
jgi:hypothetical protein